MFIERTYWTGWQSTYITSIKDWECVSWESLTWIMHLRCQVDTLTHSVAPKSVVCCLFCSLHVYGGIVRHYAAITISQVHNIPYPYTSVFQHFLPQTYAAVNLTWCFKIDFYAYICIQTTSYIDWSSTHAIQHTSWMCIAMNTRNKKVQRWILNVT